jgi:hypothetical protein
MMSLLSLFMVQAVALPAPDALQSYNWCVYRMAEVRANQPAEQAVGEALAACDGLLKAATRQVLDAASGASAAHGRLAGLLRRQARVNALARVNLIRSYEAENHAQH